MRIVHISTSDIGAGAAIAAYRLHSGLRRAGVASTMFVLQKRSADPSVVPLQIPRDPLRRALLRLHRELIRGSQRRYRRSAPDGYEQFRDDRSEYGAAMLRQLPPGEVITLHWVSGFLDYRRFFAAVGGRVPIVWRLPDLGPLTGGCHYDYGCGRFEQACGACPQLGSSDPHDLSAQVLRRKRAALANLPDHMLHIVAPSSWTAAMARRSALFGRFPITVIPNGLDVQVFAPTPKAAAREALGLPAEAPMVMFVAADVRNRRKGFAQLLEALDGLSATIPDVLLVSVGHGQPQVAGGASHRHLGYIDDDRQRALVYAAADLFIIPSLQESFGQTVIEAMACGTPVVGFAAGGIPDMVRHDRTGLLAPVGDTAALREAISALLADEPRRLRLGAEARQVALAEYASEVQVRQYLALYQALSGGPADKFVSQERQDIKLFI